MALATQPLTAEDLLRMPADGWRYELVQGELRRKPLPGFQHGRIAFSCELAITGNRSGRMCSQQEAVVSRFVKDFAEHGA